ncbi:hypothetical protein [Spongiactinospora sp. TRM90649]|uniref:hypothetical protein n=1 Tax=Spongiactinospora sp. TRM90649 TaxID=3031114 RepID=UPI0023F71D5A|nr:hypothetical protein [Spongiactinospora sp. TRM90649]MDF5759101.1 hypothetical protein [Spongiactinospora sp. TRM90649]
MTDFGLFEAMLDGLCASPGLGVVAISGGEPFAERRALSLAARRITATGRLLVLYTSGVWGTSGDPPAWIGGVLRLASCVVLGGDAFHAARMPAPAFAGAVRAVVAAGAHLVCQVLDTPRERETAARALTEALGPGWSRVAEVRPVPLLPYGRAAHFLPPPPSAPGGSFGRCPIVDAPVVRYDGWVLGCCDENVVMGAGPPALRRRATTAAEVTAALAELRDDPLLTAFGRTGLGALTAAEPYRDLAGRPMRGICDLCGHLLARAQTG